MTCGWTSWVGSWAALLSWLACVGCAPALQSPAAGGRPWYEVQSPHFLIQTDAGEGVANELTSEYERLVAFFEQQVFVASRQPSGFTRLVMFSDERDFRQLAPRLSTGYFRKEGGAPYDPHPTIVVPQRASNAEILETFRHELTHRYVAFHFPSAPAWLNEGLATYFQTVLFDGNKARMGLLPVHDLQLGKPRKGLDSPGWVALTASGLEALDALPSSGQIRALSDRDFYARDVGDSIEASTARQLHYIAAWAQVHQLMLGSDDLQSRFMRYLNALGTGREEAWATSFDAEAERALEAEYRELFKHSTFRGGELPAPALAANRAPVRSMAAWEVHWLWAALRNLDRPEERERARRDIERCIELAPDRADGYTLRAALQVEEKKRREARDSVELALRHEPNDANALGVKAFLLLGEVDQKGPNASAFRELEQAMSALEPVAKNSRQWLMLARYHKLRGNVSRALQCALRSTQDSSCWPCYWAAGDMHLARGDVVHAARYLRMAVSLAEQWAPPALRQTLADVLARSECQGTPSKC
ncbi:MAG: hypothetical protein QM756_34795 [Polyangiaceae bacterium]